VTVNAEAWRDARRILCVRLDSLGDVLMTTPALRALKECGQDTEICLLTSTSGAAVARLVSEVDEVLVYDPPWMKHTPARHDPAADLAMIQRLQSRQFDAAAIFTVYTQNPLPAAMLCYLAGIPLRLAHCRENPYQLLTDWVPEREPESGIRHEVQRQLDLVGSVGAVTDDQRLSLAVPPSDAAAAELLLARSGIDAASPWVLAHPGATAESRRYPPELFARVVRGLADRGIQVALSGSASERELCGEVAACAGVPVVSFAGQLDLPAMAGLIARAPLLLSNNTGPVHIAAAVGTPVVDIYALTNPQHTPWGVPNRVLTHDVPCRNCLRSVCPEGHHACLRGIAPEEVIDAVVGLLAEVGRPLANPTFAT
jgi:lipopolysaccharide heptosyltransferase II